MYSVDVPLHAASGLSMFTLPPKRGTTRKQKLIKKGEWLYGVVLESGCKQTKLKWKKALRETQTLRVRWL